MAGCTRYGFGCVMCIMRCPTFGGRVSISARAGVKEMVLTRADGTPGRVNGGPILLKESLAPELVAELEQKGYLVISLSPELLPLGKQSMTTEVEGTVRENTRRLMWGKILICDIGLIKLGMEVSPLRRELHRIPGLEYVRFADPLAAGLGNPVRGLAIAPRDNTMKVTGIENLYCAGEKAGGISALGGVITTGILAGHNAARNSLKKEPLELPRTTAMGDYIAYTNEKVSSGEGLRNAFWLGRQSHLEWLKKVGLDSTDPEAIKGRIERAGLRDVFIRSLT